VRHAGPPYQLIVQIRATRDARKTNLFYHRENPRLAEHFDAELGQAIATIIDAPYRWAEHEPGIRRYLVPRYHVTIYYRVRGSQVHILRVLDQRRHPDTWRTP
jgi:plasmid stabilization system protein ParE